MSRFSELIQQLDAQKLPQHIAIIMDGNGRWAKQQGQERVFGHQHGVDAVRSVIEGAGEMGVKFLTLYAFSTENWNRPKAEIDALMGLLVKAIHAELDGLMQHNVRLLTIGDTDALPTECREELQMAIAKTSANSGLSVVIALSYSAKQEITKMVQRVAEQVQRNALTISEIDSDVVEQNLMTAALPDPDLLIRTGNECRVSNFLLWQIAYAELFFPNIMWPEFRKEHLAQIVLDFQKRERRFGKTSDQLTTH